MTRRWQHYTVDNLPILLEGIAKLQLPKTVVPIEPTPEVPAPVYTLGTPVEAVLKINTNLRDAPNKAGQLIVTVKAGAALAYAEPTPPQIADGFAWVYVTVRDTAHTGWMAVHTGSLATLFIVPTKPSDPPDTSDPLPDPTGEPGPISDPPSLPDGTPEPTPDPDDTQPRPPEPTPSPDYEARIRALEKRVIQLEQLITDLVTAYGESHVTAIELVGQLKAS